MAQELRELTIEEVDEFTLEDLEALLATATEEIEPWVAPSGWPIDPLAPCPYSFLVRLKTAKARYATYLAFAVLGIP
ncbi:MAG: hypothetical protein FJY97_08405 [candidate division Zixibacteria bacterium]|nr:hypothetical protein [candidate division Zixibacteria bacterium]